MASRPTNCAAAAASAAAAAYAYRYFACGLVYFRKLIIKSRLCNLPKDIEQCRHFLIIIKALVARLQIVINL